MTPDARLVIVDSVLGSPHEDPLAKFLDLMMLVSAGVVSRPAASSANRIVRLCGRSGLVADVREFSPSIR